METDEKIASESNPFSLTGDSFPKIIVRRDIRKSWYDENGYLNIGIDLTQIFFRFSFYPYEVPVNCQVKCNT